MNLHDYDLVTHLLTDHGGFSGQIDSLAEETAEVMMELAKTMCDPEAETDIVTELTELQINYHVAYYDLTGEYMPDFFGALPKIYTPINPFELMTSFMVDANALVRLLFHSKREDKHDATKTALLKQLLDSQLELEGMLHHFGVTYDKASEVVKSKYKKHNLLYLDSE